MSGFSDSLGLFFLVVGNAIQDFFLGRFWAFPTQNLDPFAHFQIFVVLKEVRNGFQAQWV